MNTEKSNENQKENEKMSHKNPESPSNRPNITPENNEENVEIGTEGTAGGTSTKKNQKIVIETLDFFGMARRVVDQCCDRLYFCQDSGSWKTYLGDRFTSSEFEAKKMVENIINRLPNEVANGCQIEDSMGNSIDPKDHEAFCRRMRSPGAIDSTLKVARLKPELTAVEADFDADPELLNCLNGILNLRTGQLIQHSPAFKQSKIADSEYHPDAKSELFDLFIRGISDEDESLALYLQVISGYALTGYTREQSFFILYGPSTSNGKSRFIYLFQDVLGTYGLTMQFSSLLAKTSAGINNDIARLDGARCVSAIEANRGRYWDTAKINQLTGNDIVAARYLYGEYFEFVPRFKLFTAVNDLPRLSNHDDAMFRRLKVIPFRRKFYGDNLIKDLAEKLAKPDVKRAALAWAVEGAKKYLNEGIPECEAVENATNAYKSCSDLIGLFIGERCIVGEGLKIQLGALHAEYDRWAKENGYDLLKKREIRTLMIAKGYQPGKSGSSRHWKGLKIDNDPQKTQK